MEYTIGQVAKRIGVTAHTLRFYDKEGLLPNVRKNSAGIRRFSEEDLNWLGVLECLKSTGLQLKEIKHYLDLCRQGKASLQERMEIFLKQKKRIEEQIAGLQQNMEKIKFKIKYYEAALTDGEENLYEHHPELLKEREKLFNK